MIRSSAYAAATTNFVVSTVRPTHGHGGSNTPTPSEDVMKHLARLIATIVGGLGAIVVLSGTAQAYTEPIRPESGAGSVTAPDLHQASTPIVSSQGWGLTEVIGLVVVAILATLLAAAVQRVARHRREVHSPALSV